LGCPLCYTVLEGCLLLLFRGGFTSRHSGEGGVVYIPGSQGFLDQLSAFDDERASKTFEGDDRFRITFPKKDEEEEEESRK